MMCFRRRTKEERVYECVGLFVVFCLLCVVCCLFVDEDRLVENGWMDILSSGNKNMYALRTGD